MALLHFLKYSSKTRIPQLDGLRGCAISAVFLFHAYKIKTLWMGVDLFFVLSGFLITRILVNEKGKPFQNYIGQFYVRRARRILPPYLILLTLVAIAFPGQWMRFWYLYFGGMNFLVGLRLPHLEFLSSLWSLALEEQFYLLWPLAVYFLTRKQLTRLTIMMLVASPVLRFVCTPHFRSPFTVYTLLPFRADTLAAGALMALLWPELSVRLEQSAVVRRRAGWACTLVVLVSLSGLWQLERYGYSTYGNTQLGNLAVYEAVLGFVSGAFLAVLAGFGRDMLSLSPVVWLGRVSYSFYLIHLLMLYVFPQFHALLALAASIAYATISWCVIERRVLSYGPSKQTILVPAIAAVYGSSGSPPPVTK